MEVDFIQNRLCISHTFTTTFTLINLKNTLDPIRNTLFNIRISKHTLDPIQNTLFNIRNTFVNLKHTLGLK